MLVLGDVHGEKEKLISFIEYKPEEKHFLLGDIPDSFHRSDQDIYDCLDLIKKNNINSVWGNHDFAYRTNMIHTRCTGMRRQMEVNLLSIFKELESQFHLFYIEDNVILSHAGIGKLFAIDSGINNNIVSTLLVLNMLFIKMLHFFDQMGKVSLSVEDKKDMVKIMSISSIRGGIDKYGGPLWYDVLHEKNPLNKFKDYYQCFGHTNVGSTPLFDKPNKSVCMDCDENYCFNTKTKELEKF